MKSLITCFTPSYLHTYVLSLLIAQLTWPTEDHFTFFFIIMLLQCTLCPFGGVLFKRHKSVYVKSLSGFTSFSFVGCSKCLFLLALFSRMPAIGCRSTGWSTVTAASSTWMTYSATWLTTKTGWVARYERWWRHWLRLHWFTSFSAWLRVNVDGVGFLNGGS